MRETKVALLERESSAIEMQDFFDTIENPLFFENLEIDGWIVVDASDLEAEEICMLHDRDVQKELYCELEREKPVFTLFKLKSKVFRNIYIAN
ncbi:MAG: hypothetical protein ACOCQR_03840 [bacterium]